MTDQDIKVIKKLMQKLVTHSECEADFWTEDGAYVKVYRNYKLRSLNIGGLGKRIIKVRWHCKTCSMPISSCSIRDRKRDHFATFK